VIGKVFLKFYTWTFNVQVSNEIVAPKTEMQADQKAIFIIS